MLATAQRGIARLAFAFASASSASLMPSFALVICSGVAGLAAGNASRRTFFSFACFRSAFSLVVGFQREAAGSRNLSIACAAM